MKVRMGVSAAGADRAEREECPLPAAHGQHPQPGADPGLVHEDERQRHRAGTQGWGQDSEGI